MKLVVYVTPEERDRFKRATTEMGAATTPAFARLAMSQACNALGVALTPPEAPKA